MRNQRSPPADGSAMRNTHPGNIHRVARTLAPLPQAAPDHVQQPCTRAQPTVSKVKSAAASHRTRGRIGGPRFRGGSRTRTGHSATATARHPENGTRETRNGQRDRRTRVPHRIRYRNRGVLRCTRRIRKHGTSRRQGGCSPGPHQSAGTPPHKSNQECDVIVAGKIMLQPLERGLQ